jgi:hypothetical protein
MVPVVPESDLNAAVSSKPNPLRALDNAGPNH